MCWQHVYEKGVLISGCLLPIRLLTSPMSCSRYVEDEWLLLVYQSFRTGTLRKIIKLSSLGHLMKTKMMRDVCAIRFHQVPRRDLCYAPDNKRFCFSNTPSLPSLPLMLSVRFNVI